jgi:hypothetical protein
MPKTNPWIIQSVSGVGLDQRSREARLRLERIERLLVPCAAATHSWLPRLLCLFRVGRYDATQRTSRARGLLSGPRPSAMPTISGLWRVEEGLP